jgi:hypothetical protein
MDTRGGNSGADSQRSKSNHPVDPVHPPQQSTSSASPDPSPCHGVAEGEDGCSIPSHSPPPISAPRPPTSVLRPPTSDLCPPISAPRPPTSAPQPPTSVIPGNFRNTDGEMAALAIYLKAHPEIQSIALATSRFHGRRLLQRYRKHIGDHPSVGLIPGIPYWENRAPWRVLAEYLKLLRDHLGLTELITRPGGDVDCGQ